MDRESVETRWLLVAPSRNDSEGSLATLIPCPTVRKLGQNMPWSPILSVAQPLRGHRPMGPLGGYGTAAGTTGRGDPRSQRAPEGRVPCSLSENPQFVCWSWRSLPNLPPRAQKPSTGHLSPPHAQETLTVLGDTPKERISEQEVLTRKINQI